MVIFNISDIEDIVHIFLNLLIENLYFVLILKIVNCICFLNLEQMFFNNFVLMGEECNGCVRFVFKLSPFFKPGFQK